MAMNVGPAAEDGGMPPAYASYIEAAGTLYAVPGEAHA